MVLIPTKSPQNTLSANFYRDSDFVLFNFFCCMVVVFGYVVVADNLRIAILHILMRRDEKHLSDGHIVVTFSFNVYWHYYQYQVLCFFSRLKKPFSTVSYIYGVIRMFFYHVSPSGVITAEAVNNLAVGTGRG